MRALLALQWRGLALAAVCCVLPLRSHGGEAQEGKLEFYDLPCSIGLVARRVYLDAAGREAKVIYYSSREHHIEPPFDEDELVVQFIRVYHRDAQGREVREESFSRDMQLQHFWLTEYREGRKTTRTQFDPKGKKTYEIRFEGDRSVSHLYFDDRERLAAVSGTPPKDMDLVHGWGKPVGGVSCGVAFDREAGTVGELGFLVTLRNVAKETAHALTGLQYDVMRVELRDAAGAVVAQNTRYIEQRHKDLLGMNHGPNFAKQTLWAGYAMHVAHYELKEWYGELPPGAYSLTVAWRGLEGGFPILSNPAPVRITARP